MVRLKGEHRPMAPLNTPLLANTSNRGCLFIRYKFGW